MKKRILSAVALLCMVVCLSGCDSQQWSKTELESISYDIPADWETVDSISNKRHYLKVDGQIRYVIHTWDLENIYDTPMDYINRWASLGISFTSIGDTTIDGEPAYTCTFLSDVGDLNEIYAFNTSDGVYAVIFTDIEGEAFPDDIREHVLDSIQIND